MLDVKHEGERKGRRESRNLDDAGKRRLRRRISERIFNAAAAGDWLVVRYNRARLEVVR